MVADLSLLVKLGRLSIASTHMTDSDLIEPHRKYGCKISHERAMPGFDAPYDLTEQRLIATCRCVTRPGSGALTLAVQNIFDSFYIDYYSRPSGPTTMPIISRGADAISPFPGTIDSSEAD
ncbi:MULTISPECIES: hypothetical protein [unclassified Sphingobium]|uniref:hypothetical protein n=1 Tax=unclassified Sphingobium TaxID=2611147 RepID=UPI000ABDDD5E|nr:hypothetical protein [Sphingobium sp. TB-6]